MGGTTNKPALLLKVCWYQTHSQPQAVNGGTCLLQQSVKGGKFASGAVILQHAAQHHDAWLHNLSAHELVHHVLAEHQPIDKPAVSRLAHISNSLHLMHKWQLSCETSMIVCYRPILPTQTTAKHARASALQ